MGLLPLQPHGHKRRLPVRVDLGRGLTGQDSACLTPPEEVTTFNLVRRLVYTVRLRGTGIQLFAIECGVRSRPPRADQPGSGGTRGSGRPAERPPRWGIPTRSHGQSRGTRSQHPHLVKMPPTCGRLVQTWGPCGRPGPRGVRALPPAVPPPAPRDGPHGIGLCRPAGHLLAPPDSPLREADLYVCCTQWRTRSPTHRSVLISSRSRTCGRRSVTCDWDW